MGIHFEVEGGMMERHMDEQGERHESTQTFEPQEGERPDGPDKGQQSPDDDSGLPPAEYKDDPAED